MPYANKRIRRLPWGLLFGPKPSKPQSWTLFKTSVTTDCSKQGSSNPSSAKTAKAGGTQKRVQSASFSGIRAPSKRSRKRLPKRLRDCWMEPSEVFKVYSAGV